MKNKILHILIFLMAIGTPYKYCRSQEVIVDGKIATDSILTGHPFDYSLDIRMPKGYIINWNELKDTLNKSVEVISRSEIKEQPIDNSSDILLTQHLTLASFDTGYVEIPSIGIKYYKSAKDTNVYTSYTDYMYIYVEPAAIDTKTGKSSFATREVTSSKTDATNCGFTAINR